MNRGVQFKPGWPLMTLGMLEARGLITLGRGKVISRQDIELEPGDFPVYSSSVNHSGLFGTYNEFMFDEELITWSVDGGGDFFYRPKHKFSVTNVTGYLRINVSYLDYRFLFYVLDLQHRHLVFDYIGKAHPSVIRPLYAVPMIDIAEQTAIADILSTVDEAIAQTETLIAKQRRIKAGLLHDLLTRGIDENGQLRDPATHRFKQTAVGWVPEEWEVTSFDTLIASAIDGPFGSSLKTEHYVQDNGVRVVRLQNIGAGLFQDGDKAYVSRQHAQHLYRHEVLPGDLLVAALGDSNHPMGRTCLFPNGFPPAINKADCFRIRLKPVLALHGFVMHVLNSPIVRAQIEGLSQGVTRDRINLTKMRSIVLPKPPLAEQQRIDSCMIHQDDFVIDLDAQMEKYRRLKIGLMQDLLSGRVRVLTTGCISD